MSTVAIFIAGGLIAGALITWGLWRVGRKAIKDIMEAIYNL